MIGLAVGAAAVFLSPSKIASRKPSSARPAWVKANWTRPFVSTSQVYAVLYYQILDSPQNEMTVGLVVPIEIIPNQSSIYEHSIQFWVVLPLFVRFQLHLRLCLVGNPLVSWLRVCVLPFFFLLSG